MARRLRIHLPGAFYHVTLRGNHRRRIFRSDADRQLLGRIVAESLCRIPAHLHAYCWMPNHVHMLVQAGNQPIGRLILRIASRYARAVQRQVPTTGHLFERRYHSVLVDADSYLLSLLRYIHLNPVRAGIVARPADYPWSSHHAYLGARVEPWVTTDFALSLWSTRPATARGRYRQFMDRQPASAQTSPLLQVNRTDPRVLGNDHFVQQVARASGEDGPQAALDELIDGACRSHAVEPDELRSPRRHRRLVKVRALVAYEAVTRQIASAAQVARRPNRSESAIRELLQRHYANIED